MQIRFLKPGLLTTIQDLGRPKYRSLAVPLSGVMDNLSARIANKLVGNNDNDAVLEFTYADAAFIADTDILIAYAGLGAKLMADELPIPANKPIFILAGTIIKLVSRPEGCRTYLAVAAGWQVPDILGSKSTFLTAGFGGFEGRILRKNDCLLNNNLSILSQKILNAITGKSINYPKWSVASPLLWPTDKKTIRVIPANEFSWFDEHGTTSFLTMPYTIGLLSDRMGYRFDGPAIKRNTTKELLSTAVTPGTIQVTGNGSLILLMADCQTTGGYPRIAQVAAVDLPLCAQLKPGDTINFKEISRLEAENLYIEREQQLRQLTAAIAIKFI